jgi:iron-sulfur cluster repair protein YtfE (RIC family)
MNMTAERTVRELALENTAATRVFEKLGIDYCCGGNKSLAFTWRTTFCFRVQSQWKSLTERGNHVRTSEANRTRGRPAVNADRDL